MIGLHFLKEGDNAVGGLDTDDSVAVKFNAPSLKGKVGVVNVNDGVVTFQRDANIENLTVADKPIEADEKVELSDSTLVKHGTLTWYVKSVSEKKYAIRVRDTESPVLKNYTGVEFFPIDLDFVVEAKVK